MMLVVQRQSSSKFLGWLRIKFESGLAGSDGITGSRLHFRGINVLHGFSQKEDNKSVIYFARRVN